MTSAGDNINLAAIIGRQLKTIRTTLDSHGFVEVLVPHIQPLHPTPFLKSFHIVDPEDSSRVGTIESCVLDFVEATLPAVGRAYCITPIFRADRPQPNRLLEFQYVQACGDGNRDAAMALAEELLTNVHSVLLKDGLLPGERAAALSSISAPFPRIQYEEALTRAGNPSEGHLAIEHYLGLAKEFHDQPFFITNIPLDVEARSYTDKQYDHDGRSEVANFELIAPFSGEVFAGSETETSRDRLTEQGKSSKHFQELRRAGLGDNVLDRNIEVLSLLPSPTFTVSAGFERITQYLLGSDSIEKAALYPVTNRIFTASPIHAACK